MHIRIRTHKYIHTHTHLQVAKLQRASLRNPVRVEVSSKYQTVTTLKQYYMFKPAIFKDLYLAHLLIDEEITGKSTIIFVNVCKEAQRYKQIHVAVDVCIESVLLYQCCK